MTKCINAGCFNGTFVEGGECPACLLTRAATRDTLQSGYSGSSLFSQIAPATDDNAEQVEWPDEIDKDLVP